MTSGGEGRAMVKIMDNLRTDLQTCAARLFVVNKRGASQFRRIAPARKSTERASRRSQLPFPSALRQTGQTAESKVGAPSLDATAAARQTQTFFTKEKTH